MSERRRWAENVGAVGIALLVGLVAIPAGISVHEYAPQWEVAGIFISLGVGLVPALWYLRTRRHGWLVSILSGLLLGFSFMSALAYGWETQATLVVYIGMGAIIVVATIMTHRATRDLESAMREAYEEEVHLHGPVLFRDDGERITVYPSRRRLLQQCAIQALFLTVVAGIFAFIPTDSVLMLWLARLLTGLVAVVLVASLFRLVVRQPTLVVGPDGIFDHGTLIVTGIGLIRWDEIIGVTQYQYPRTAGRLAQRYLSILVGDAHALRARQPIWKRVALRFTTSSWLGFDVWQGLLSMPADELADQIRRYAETHAPPGFLEEEDAEDGAESAPAAE